MKTEVIRTNKSILVSCADCDWEKSGVVHHPSSVARAHLKENPDHTVTISRSKDSTYRATKKDTDPGVVADLGTVRVR